MASGLVGIALKIYRASSLMVLISYIILLGYRILPAIAPQTADYNPKVVKRGVACRLFTFIQAHDQSCDCLKWKLQKSLELWAEVVLAEKLPALVVLALAVKHQLEFVCLDRLLREVVLVLLVRQHRRRKQRIHAQSEQVLYHVRNDTLQDGGGDLQARVGVDLEQPGIEIGVYNKVQAKQLESFPLGTVDQGVGSTCYSFGDFFHLAYQNLQLPVLLGQGLIQVSLELVIAQLVALLKLAVHLALILNRVIGKMDHGVEFFEIERVGAGSYIALRIPEIFPDSPDYDAEHIGSYIEFSAFVEQKVGLVLLNNSGASLNEAALDGFADLLNLAAQEDASSSIGILAWLHYPQTVLICLVGLLVLQVFGAGGIFYVEGFRHE